MAMLSGISGCLRISSTVWRTVFNIVKTGQPAVQIDTGIAQGFDAVVGDIAVVYALEELFGVQSAHTAIVVGNDHDFFDFKFKYGDQQTAHYRTPRMGHQRAGVFDELGVTIFQAQRIRQQLDNACVHAGKDGQLAAGVFVGEIFFVFARFDEMLVIGENFAQFAHDVLVSDGLLYYNGFRVVRLFCKFAVNG